MHCPETRVRTIKTFAIKTVSLVTTIFILTACGGGGGSSSKNDSPAPAPAPAPDPGPKTGVFIDGPVQGLRFATSTQSGLTNASGEFQYEDGETVTFSIGGITLGSALGANQITPFDLFGLTPPSTEAAIRAELATRNDVTDFDRVANMAWLLVSLDNDNNPSNGLDVSGWDATLADAILSFDSNFFDFIENDFDRFSRIYGGNRDLDPAAALVHLYESLEIAVLSNLVAKRETDEGLDGDVEYTSWYEYDDKGRIIKLLQDNNGDGVSDGVAFTSYNAQGQQTKHQYVYSFAVDGVTPLEYEQTTTVYNAQNKPAQRQYFYDDGAGNVEYTETNFEYQSGNLIKVTDSSDDENDGIFDSLITTLYTYDDIGNQLTATILKDTDNNDVDESSESHVYEYDSGNLIKNRYEKDSSLLVAGVNYRRDRVYGYDSDGNQISFTEFLDATGNGEWNRIEKNTYEYDSAGNKTTRMSVIDLDDDPLTDPISTLLVEYAYDGNNQLVTETQQKDGSDAGIEWDSKAVTTYTYNPFGDALVVETENDTDLDGNIESAVRKTYTYTPEGFQTSNVEEADNNGDKNWDARRTYAYSLSAEGALLSNTETNDNDADGPNPASGVRDANYAYVTVPNGIAGIIYAAIYD